MVSSYISEAGRHHHQQKNMVCLYHHLAGGLLEGSQWHPDQSHALTQSSKIWASEEGPFEPTSTLYKLIVTIDQGHKYYWVKILVVEIVGSSLPRLPYGKMRTINSTKTMMILPSPAHLVHYHYPIVWCCWCFNDLFMVVIHNRLTHIRDEQTNGIVSHSEAIL